MVIGALLILHFPHSENFLMLIDNMSESSSPLKSENLLPISDAPALVKKEDVFVVSLSEANSSFNRSL
jgi:hypothetical protein